MSRIVKPFVWTTSLALVAGVAQGVVPDGKDIPYQVILTRNAFGLKPPPPPPPVKTEEEEGPPPNIKLTGILSITEPKKALFMLQPVGKAEKTFLTINEGEEDQGLKVLSIDEERGSVKIVLNGNTTTLDFEKNGIKNAAVVVPVAGQPGGPPAGAVPPPPGGFTQPGQPQPSIRTVPSAAPATPTPRAPGGAPGSPTSPIPTRSLRTQPQSLGPAAPANPVSAEESVVLKKVDELVNQDKIKNNQYPPALPLDE